MKQKQQQRNLVQRLWHEAWSDIWGYITIGIGGICSCFSYLGSVVNDPNVQTTLSELKLPAIAGLIIAIIGAVTVISAEHPAGNT